MNIHTNPKRGEWSSWVCLGYRSSWDNTCPYSPCISLTKCFMNVRVCINVWMSALIGPFLGISLGIRWSRIFHGLLPGIGFWEKGRFIKVYFYRHSVLSEKELSKGDFLYVKTSFDMLHKGVQMRVRCVWLTQGSSVILQVSFCRLQLCSCLIRLRDLIFPTGESKNSYRMETPKTGLADG